MEINKKSLISTTRGVYRGVQFALAAEMRRRTRESLN
jgi:hypothetical protein